MIKISLVDDDPEDRASLISLVQEIFQNKNITFSYAEFESAEDFLASYESGLYDLCFLDIFMKNSIITTLSSGVNLKTNRYEIPSLSISKSKSAEQPLFFSSSFEIRPEAVKVKPSFILVHSHITLYHSTFRVRL